VRPPAADDVRGHEEIEQLAEPLHEGRNDERTERCRRSTWGLALLFATQAEPEVNFQGEGSEQKTLALVSATPWKWPPQRLLPRRPSKERHVQRVTNGSDG